MKKHYLIAAFLLSACLAGCGALPGSVPGTPISTKDASQTFCAKVENIDACPNADFDGDGLTNAEEIAAGTDPTLSDTDGDLLSDGEEVNQYQTNPLVRDTDGDFYNDKVEIDLGTDPNNAASYPNLDPEDPRGCKFKPQLCQDF